VADLHIAKERQGERRPATAPLYETQNQHEQERYRLWHLPKADSPKVCYGGKTDITPQTLPGLLVASGCLAMRERRAPGGAGRAYANIFQRT